MGHSAQVLPQLGGYLLDSKELLARNKSRSGVSRWTTRIDCVFLNSILGKVARNVRVELD